jgi:hypothetical protein
LITATTVSLRCLFAITAQRRFLRVDSRQTFPAACALTVLAAV